MWVLCDREPVRNWTRGRVTLLGDAAPIYHAGGATADVRNELLKPVPGQPPGQAMAWLYDGIDG